MRITTQMSRVEGFLEIAIIGSLLCNSSYNLESNWATFLSNLLSYIPISLFYALRKTYECIRLNVFLFPKEMISPKTWDFPNIPCLSRQHHCPSGCEKPKAQGHPQYVLLPQSPVSIHYQGLLLNLFTSFHLTSIPLVEFHHLSPYYCNNSLLTGLPISTLVPL